jgi:hypothetical protein
LPVPGIDHSDYNGKRIIRCGSFSLRYVDTLPCFGVGIGFRSQRRLQRRALSLFSEAVVADLAGMQAEFDELQG